MNITIYTLNNWLPYFISVITSIAVRLDYCRSTVRAVYITITRKQRQGYASNPSRQIEVGQRVVVPPLVARPSERASDNASTASLRRHRLRTS